MPVYKLDLKNKYYSLYCAIRADILRGKYKSGQKLPSKRALAADLGVSVVTVELAYGQLLAEGYITGRERSGYFVESISAPPRQNEGAQGRPPAKEEVKGKNIDLVSGATPARLFPFSVWSKLTRGVLLNCGEQLLERVPCEGDLELRREISQYLYRSRGIEAEAERIIIGAGAEYLYGLIVQLLGRDKLFAVENPGYKKIFDTYALNGAKIKPVTVTSSGVAAEELASADVLHISPSHQFPTGVITPVSARLRLAGWARSGGKYIIEDDYDSEFRLSGRPLESMCGLCGDRVIYINTFSKTLAPSMRMGYMVLPPALYGKYAELFSSSANVVPLFEQKTLAAFLGGGYFERHISRLKKYYNSLRKNLCEALSKLHTGIKFYDTGGGLHFLVKCRGLNDGGLKELFLSHGISVKCLGDYLLSPAKGFEGYAVINYSGLTAENIAALNNL